MARSMRSDSRNVSPPKPPVGTANDRVTRSQSKDLGNDDAPRIEHRKMRRSARQTSADSTGSEASKSNRRRNINTDLPMVEEDEGEDQLQQDEPGPSNSRSIPVHSEAPELSQSAAAATESQELSDLDTNLIKDALPLLNRHSSEIIWQIPRSLTTESVANIMDLMATPKSKLAKRMRNFRGHLETSRANCGEGVFINNDIILQKLFGTNNPYVGSSRPDAIVYKTNIAVLIDTLLAPELGIEFMTILDEEFPLSFMAASYMENEDDTWQTFDLALEIRTQLAILILQDFQGHDNSDPDSIIAQIFYHGDEALSAEEILTQAIPRPIAGLSLAETTWQSESIAARIDEIRQETFDDTQAHDTKEYMDMAELRQKFPWDRFLIRIIKWLQERAIKYDDDIKERGGAEKIVEALSKEMPNPDHNMTLPLDTPPVVTTSEPSSTSNVGVESAAEKRRRLRTNAREIRPPGVLKSKTVARVYKDPTPKVSKPMKDIPSRRAAEESHSGDDGMPDAAGARDDSGVEEPNFGEILATWKVAEKENNKENNRPTGEPGRLDHAPPKRFLDPQAGAKKVTLDEDHDETPVKASRSNRKRSQENTDMDDGLFIPEQREIVDEAEEDDDFQKDMRDPHPKRPSPKRQRVQPSGSNAQRVGSELPNRSRSRQLEADEDIDGQDIVPSQSYKDVNKQAKRQMALNKPLNTNTRVPWTSAESEAFVDLIGTYGNGWAMISKSKDACDSIQERHRDQVALKDKARNMKVDYLLSGLPLPSNFDLINLGQKEKAKVIKAGFNPYRREGERVGEESLDENGEPIE